jgi:hypothetical protein
VQQIAHCSIQHIHITGKNPRGSRTNFCNVVTMFSRGLLDVLA